MMNVMAFRIICGVKYACTQIWICTHETCPNKLRIPLFQILWTTETLAQGKTQRQQSVHLPSRKRGLSTPIQWWMYIVIVVVPSFSLQSNSPAVWSLEGTHVIFWWHDKIYQEPAALLRLEELPAVYNWFNSHDWNDTYIASCIVFLVPQIGSLSTTGQHVRLSPFSSQHFQFGVTFDPYILNMIHWSFQRIWMC